MTLAGEKTYLPAGLTRTGLGLFSCCVVGWGLAGCGAAEPVDETSVDSQTSPTDSLSPSTSNPGPSPIQSSGPSPVSPTPSPPDGPNVTPPGSNGPGPMPSSSSPTNPTTTGSGPVPSPTGGGGAPSLGNGGAPNGGTSPDGNGGTPGTGNAAAGGSLTGPGGEGSGGSDVVPMEGEVIFTEDFEAQTPGGRPSGWDDFVGWQKNNPNPAPDNYATVGTEQVYGGSQAIHFVGGTNPAQITRALPGGTNKIYVSARVWMTRQLGQNPGANHETLIAIRGTSGDANNEVRFGEIKGVIGTNEVPSDNISPLMDQWGLGPIVPANTWACFEVAFIADQPQHELHAWVDGELVHSITMPDQWQNGAMPATWMDGKFTEVVFGWHSFSSQNIEVWMDDITVATGRRGCL